MNPEKWLASQSAISQCCKVNPKTAKYWIAQPWFPTRRKYGWAKSAVMKAVDKHNEEKDKMLGSEKIIDKKRKLECKKLRVVIAIEEERLEQEKIETATLKGKVVLWSEVLAAWTERNLRIRQRVELFRKGQGAKRRGVAAKKLIDGVCGGILDELADEFCAKKGGGES